MFVFQVECEAGKQPKRDGDGYAIPGECEPCPFDTYKPGDVDWKAECSACAGREGYVGKDYTLETGSTSPDQCMGEFILL